MYFWRTSSSTGEGLYMSLGEDYGLQDKMINGWVGFNVKKADWGW